MNDDKLKQRKFTQTLTLLRKLREQKAHLVIVASTDIKVKQGTKNKPSALRGAKIQRFWHQNARLGNYAETVERRTGETIEPTPLRDNQSYVNGCDSLVQTVKKDGTVSTRLQFEKLGGSQTETIAIDGEPATPEQIELIDSLRPASGQPNHVWGSVLVENILNIIEVE